MGYPPFLISFLGLAKIAGVAGILQSRFVLLKEWAYAGLTLNLIGAIWSHLAVGDGPIAPLFFTLLLATSYVLYRRRNSLQLRYKV
jgi:hypothetical protein